MYKLNPEMEAKKLFAALEHQPLSALLKLSKLFYLALSTPEAKILVEELANQLSSQAIEKMLKSLAELNQHDFNVLDPKTQSSIEALKVGLLREPKWATLCSTLVLEQLGSQMSLLRWATLRLIEQSNPEQPFEIPAVAIDDAGSEQTYQSIAEKLKHAKRLPMESLLNLTQTVDSATEILALLSSHPDVYKLGKSMVDKLPELAPQLAMQWSLIKATAPIEPNSIAELNRYSKQLESKHPEFKSIDESHRAYQKPILSDSKSNPYSRFFNLESGAALAWSLVNAPSFYRLSHACYVGARTLLYSSAGPTPAALGLSALMLGTRFVTPVATYAAGKKLYKKLKQG